MKRLLAVASALSLVGLAACVSEAGDSVAATAPTADTTLALAPVASTEALPQAVALSGPEDALVLPITYRCADGRAFTAVFPEHGRSVTVSAEGDSRVLPHNGAADAVMFSADGVTLTAEGADATLTGLGAAFVSCAAG